MGDVIPILKKKGTPKIAAEQLLANVKESDLSPMSTERMYYLGGILQNFAMMHSSTEL